MKKLLLAVSVCSLSVPANASDWWMIGFPAGRKLHHQAYFVDKASIADVRGFRRAWLAMVNEAPVEGIKSFRSCLQIDCEQSRYLTLQNSTIWSTGKRSEQGPFTDWQFIMPDSPMSTMANSVCSGAFYDGMRVKGHTPESFAPIAFKASNAMRH